MNEKLRRRLPPALALLVLSPTLGELLSGSSPPLEFFNPVTFILLAGLYGSGAILVRELTLRWQKGWPTLLVLGVAYAIVEEGLMCKSFFDANWPDVGVLGVYGRWLGVNWVWTVHLIGFHTAFSIAAPILLVEVLYPDRKSEPWVSARQFRILLYAMAIVVALGFCFFPKPENPFVPPPIGFGLAVVTVILLVVLARRLPPALSLTSASDKLSRAFYFFTVGFAGTFLWFVVFWTLPQAPVHALLTCLLGLTLSAVVLLAVLRQSGEARLWGERHRLALAAGALMFFILLAPLQELDNPKRPDDTSFMTAAGLGVAVFLLWLWRQVRAREKAKQA
jgi:hypothetical protein